MITKEIALSLHFRQTLYHVRLKNRDGSAVRCRVNSACKTWITRPEDYRLPVKHGFRECFYITPQNAAEWTLAVSEWVEVEESLRATGQEVVSDE